MTLPEWLQDRANSEGPALRKAHMAKMRKMTTLLHQELLKQTVEKHRLNAEIQALATEARNKPPDPNTTRRIPRCAAPVTPPRRRHGRRIPYAHDKSRRRA